MAFASQATILPAFAAHLGASNVVIGAIPAIATLGWFLPSLFVAHHTETLARKLPFILRYTIWERLPLPTLAAVAFLLAGPAPGLSLGMVLGLLLLMTGVGGALVPAWMDVIARTIPSSVRGRFFGAANVFASLGSVGASVVTAYLLAAIAPPASYGVCFLAGSVFVGLSYAALRAGREPPAVPRAEMPLRAYLATMPALLRRDRSLAWFLVARGAVILGMAATGFFTVYALQRYRVADWWAGIFGSLLFGGQLGGNLLLGWLADRAGHRIVLVLGAAALAGANLVALTAGAVEPFQGAFVLLGVHQAALHVSGRTILLELARDPVERPTYIGLAGTALAPVAFLAPIGAGLALDRTGYPLLFAVTAGFAGLAVALLVTRVREPRPGGAPGSGVTR